MKSDTAYRAESREYIGRLGVWAVGLHSGRITHAYQLPPHSPDQGLLLPTLLSEWLPEDHLAYFISDAVEAMDLGAFYARYEGDGRWRQPFARDVSGQRRVAPDVYGDELEAPASTRMDARMSTITWGL